MAQMINTGSSTINGDVQSAPNIPAPSSSQTFINIYEQGTGSAVNQRTVTTGKTFYLMGVATSDASTTIEFFDTTPSVMLLTLASGTAGGVVLTSVCPICSWASGEHVNLKVTNGKEVNFWGFEQ